MCDDSQLELRFTPCIYQRFSYRILIRKVEMRERLWTQATPSLAPLALSYVSTHVRFHKYPT